MIHKVMETAIVQLNIPSVPLLFPLPASSFSWTLLKCWLASTVPSPKGILLLVLEMYPRLHLTASSEMRSSASYIRQLTGDTQVWIRGQFFPTLLQWREGLPHFPPLKEEARGQRGSGLKLSSHALSILRRCREKEATCSSRESQHCWLESRHDSEHK